MSRRGGKDEDDLKAGGDEPPAGAFPLRMMIWLSDCICNEIFETVRAIFSVSHPEESGYPTGAVMAREDQRIEATTDGSDHPFFWVKDNIFVIDCIRRSKDMARIDLETLGEITEAYEEPTFESGSTVRSIRNPRLKTCESTQTVQFRSLTRKIGTTRCRSSSVNFERLSHDPQSQLTSSVFQNSRFQASLRPTRRSGRRSSSTIQKSSPTAPLLRWLSLSVNPTQQDPTRARWSRPTSRFDQNQKKDQHVMTLSLFHIADRVLNRPLLIMPEKLAIIGEVLAGGSGSTPRRSRRLFPKPRASKANRPLSRSAAASKRCRTAAMPTAPQLSPSSARW